MGRCLPIVCALLLGLAIAKPTQALEMRITYGLTAEITVPNLFTAQLPLSGQATATVPATGGGALLSGNAIVTAQFSGQQTLPGLARGIGLITVAGSGPFSAAAGALTAGLQGEARFLLTCLAGFASCAAANLPHLVPTVLAVTNLSTTAFLGGVGNQATIPFVPFSFTLLGTPVLLLNVTAQEISRELVPEPTSLSLHALGLGMMVMAGRAKLRRRRTGSPHRGMPA